MVVSQSRIHGVAVACAMLWLSWSCSHWVERANCACCAARCSLCVLGVRGRGDGAQRATQTVIADDLGHAQDAGGHTIAAQCAYMGVAAMSVQDRQHPRAEHVGKRGGVRTRVAQRAALEPPLEQSRGFEVLGEEGQLAQRSRTASLVPAHREHASRRVHSHRFVRRLDHRVDGLLTRQCNRLHRLDRRQFTLTHRVPPRVDLKPAPSLRLRQVATGQLRKIG